MKYIFLLGALFLILPQFAQKKKEILLEVKRYQEIEAMSQIIWENLSDTLDYEVGKKVYNEVVKHKQTIDIIDSLIEEKYPYTKKLHHYIIERKY